jgi:hypothetical protein
MPDMLISFNENSVDINLAIIIKPYWLSNIGFLIHAVNETRKKLADRIVNIYALVQTPISIEPYCTVLNIIVDNLQISPDRILVHTRDPSFHHAGVTKIPYNVWDERFRQEYYNPYLLSLDLMQPSSDNKRFGALFGRIQLGRILLAYHLETFHGKSSIVSFLADKDGLQHETYGYENLLETVQDWWNHRQNPKISPQPDHKFGEYNGPQNILTYPSVAKLFQIEIVCETQYDHLGDYTEKTWRSLATGKPFILLSGPGNIKLLHDLGFETFHPWIDESYDQLTNFIARTEAICTEIDRLASLDQTQWQHTIAALYEIARRNRAFYRAWHPVVSLP